MNAIVDFFVQPTDPAEATAKLDLFARLLSIVLLGIGVVRWAMIVGIFADPAWRFEVMPTEWQVALVNLAVANLVAAVGLWMRVAWGHVIWLYAVIAEVLMHTVFIGTFGTNFPMLGFHLVTVAVFAILYVRVRRSAE